MRAVAELGAAGDHRAKVDGGGQRRESTPETRPKVRRDAQTPPVVAAVRIHRRCCAPSTRQLARRSKQIQPVGPTALFPVDMALLVAVNTGRSEEQAPGDEAAQRTQDDNEGSAK